MKHMALENTETVDVAATPSQLFGVVADVTRIIEWSHECRRARWHGPSSGPLVGARFRGWNRSGLLVWSRMNTILEVEPTRRLVWQTGGFLGIFDSTIWMLTFDELPDGRTRIEQSYRIVKLVPWWGKAMSLINPAHRDRSAALNADLVRLGEVAVAQTR
ncbi:MAG: SRPBCC family protein [Nocardiaceae bacterium]|nr:SRPBCC family protein [Nocardiaceae bacterium]